MRLDRGPRRGAFPHRHGYRGRVVGHAGAGRRPRPVDGRESATHGAAVHLSGYGQWPARGQGCFRPPGRSAHRVRRRGLRPDGDPRHRPRADLFHLLQRIRVREPYRARRLGQHSCGRLCALTGRPTAGNGRRAARQQQPRNHQARSRGYRSPLHDLCRWLRQRRPERARGLQRAGPRGGLYPVHGLPTSRP